MEIIKYKKHINKKPKVKMSKATKTTKATKTPTQYVYAYVFNGGVLKQNHCVVSVTTEHPETTVFNELKRYYGNDVKGAYYKCSKSLEDVQAGITFKLSKFALGEILYNNNFTETKKILLDVTGLKQCSGTINVYNKGDDDDETEQKAEKVEQEEKKTEKKSDKKADKKSSSKDKGGDTKKASKKVVNDGSDSDDDVQPKTNNTSIELSDESDEEDTN